MNQSDLAPRLACARVAVFALFLTNGALFANIVPRYPEIKDVFGLSDPAYGATIALFSLGSIALGALAVELIAKYSSATTAVIGTVGIGAALAIVGAATVWRDSMGELAGSAGVFAYGLFALAFLLAGGLDAVTDVGQNAHGLRVQRLYGRPLINGFHGGWSVGAMIGGVMGTAASALGIPIGWHLLAAALVFIAVGFLASRFALPGKDPAVGEADPILLEFGARASAPADVPGGIAAVTEYAEGPDGQMRVRTVGRSAPIVIAALTALCIACMLIEDAGASWSALYMRDYIGVVPGAVGLAYVSLLAAQTIGRLTADRIMALLGAKRTVLLGAILITCGMGLAVAFPSAIGTVSGMAFAGFGCAPLIPIAYNAADDIPGLKPGVGLTIVTWLCRLAPLSAPPLVGLIVESTSLRAAMIVVPLAGLLAFAMSTVIAPTPRRRARN